jgi:hypothetical protein
MERYRVVLAADAYRYAGVRERERERERDASATLTRPITDAFEAQDSLIVLFVIERTRAPTLYLADRVSPEVLGKTWLTSIARTEPVT